MFDNIKKLTKYPWSGEFFNHLKPTENSIPVPETVKKDINEGAKFLYIYEVLLCISSIFLAIRFTNRLGWLGQFVNNTNYQVSSIINAIVSAGIGIAVIYFLTRYLTSKEARKPIVYFIIVIISLLGLVFLIPSLLGMFGLAAFDIIYCLLMLGATGVAIIGYSNVLVGCIDFCLAANQNNAIKNAEKNTQKK